MGAQTFFCSWYFQLSSPKRLRCHTPSTQYGGRKGGPGAVFKIHVQTDSILVVHSDLTVGTYKWSPANKKDKLKPDKLRALPNREVSTSRAAIKRGSAAPQTMKGSGSSLSVGHWSFAVTLGGYEKEQLRRKAVMFSRLASAKDALYTEASPLIVSCGYWDNTVKIHSADAWRLESSENGGHRGPIRCLAVGQDGGLLVTGGQDATCRVWVVDHPDMAIALSDGYVQTAQGHMNDGDQILSCCHVLWGHDTPITCLDLSSDLDVTISGSMGGLICIHTIRRGDFIRSIQAPCKDGSPVSRLALGSHGTLVVQMGDNGLHTYTINGVRLCSVDAGERLHDMKITGQTLVTGGDRCYVYIRNLMTLQILSMLDLSRHGPIRCLSLTPEELNPIQQFLFIGSDDGMITIVDKEMT
jgi:WD40 repeat protein